MTSNNDCCVRLFDVEGMRPRQRLEFPFAVNYATLRPDGAALGGGPVVAVVGDDPLTWLVDCRSGLEVRMLQGGGVLMLLVGRSWPVFNRELGSDRYSSIRRAVVGVCCLLCTHSVALLVEG
jgi:hypothetical protein